MKLKNMFNSFILAPAMGSDLSSLASASSSIHISSGSESGRLFFNGREYRGRTLNSINGRVFVDGKPVDEIEAGVKYSPITIKIEGNVTGDIDVPYAEKVEITGDLHGSIKTQSGNIHVGGAVSQDAKTMSGNVVVGGDVHGRASTMSGNVFTGQGAIATAPVSSQRRPALKALMPPPPPSQRRTVVAAPAKRPAVPAPPPRTVVTGGVIKREPTRPAPANAVKLEPAAALSLKRPRDDDAAPPPEPAQKKPRV